MTVPLSAIDTQDYACEKETDRPTDQQIKSNFSVFALVGSENLAEFAPIVVFAYKSLMDNPKFPKFETLSLHRRYLA